MVKKLLPLTGLIAVIVGFISFAIAGNTPRADSSAAEVADFYTRTASSQITVAYALAWTAPFLMAFAAVLATRFWRSESRSFSLITLGGGIAGGTGFLLASALHFAVAEGAQNGYPAESLRILSALDQDALVLFTGGVGILLIGASGLLLSQKGLSRWLGVVALIAGVSIFLPAGIGAIAFAVSAVWIVFTSLTLTFARSASSEG